MNLQEINFEQAKLLKQAGFVEHTTKFYDKNGVLTGSLPVNHNLHKDRFSCVTIALVVLWLMVKTDYELSVVHPTEGSPNYKYLIYHQNKIWVSSEEYEDYEITAERGLTRLLSEYSENIKENLL